VAFWYLDKPAAVPLQPYAERTAASKAREYGKPALRTGAN
jgi:hypothetical protein